MISAVIQLRLRAWSILNWTHFLSFKDQLIIYMALANGKSRIRTATPVTLHTETAIYIAELMTEVSCWWLVMEMNQMHEP